MPKYEVKSSELKGATDKKDDARTFTFGVISGIIGDTYGFNRGDACEVTIKSISKKTEADIDAECELAVADFITKKYPNT